MFLKQIFLEQIFLEQILLEQIFLEQTSFNKLLMPLLRTNHSRKKHYLNNDLTTLWNGVHLNVIIAIVTLPFLDSCQNNQIRATEQDRNKEDSDLSDIDFKSNLCLRYFYYPKLHLYWPSFYCNKTSDREEGPKL